MKRKKIARTGWVLDHGNGFYSALLHHGELGEEFVRKEIKCAKACGEPKPKFIKVRITEIKRQSGR